MPGSDVWSTRVRSHVVSTQASTTLATGVEFAYDASYATSTVRFG